MKKNIVTQLVMYAGMIAYVALLSNLESTNEKYNRFISEHPNSKRNAISTSEMKAIPKKDRPDLAAEREFLLTMDPVLKRPTPEKLIPTIEKVYELKKLKKNKVLPGTIGYEWVARGPNNVGGRTRAVMFDPIDADNKKAWAGGVGGGLWYNNDITDSNSPWLSVDDFWENIAVSCMTFNPLNPNEFYVGTGEGWVNHNAFQDGGGVWKSGDAGTTWNRLAATTGSEFSGINDVIVDPTNGYLYVTTRDGGFKRSKDGGDTFENLDTGFYGDLEIGADNSIYVTKGNAWNSGDILRSTTGDVGTWVSLIGNGFPTTGVGRVDISTSMSNENVVYAVTHAFSTNGVENIYRSNDKGASWNVLNMPVWSDGGEFSRGQAWYDLIIAVDPTDEDKVYVGGVDLFRSDDGGNNWNQLSFWSLTPGNSNYAHADQHNIAFQPGNADFVVFASDGGLSISTDNGENLETRVNEYNVTQFYSCAIHPDSLSEVIIGGAQDNGTHIISADGIQPSMELIGGDGAFCFIDQHVDDIMIVSTQNGNFYKFEGGSYAGPIIGGSTGAFINPADYDDYNNTLYTCIKNSVNSINRIVNIDGLPSTEVLSTNLNASVTHLRAYPDTLAGTTMLFVGTRSSGVYRIDNAQDGTATTSDISPPGSGSVSCIEVGSSDRELLVTFSNYGVTSVFYTNNGGTDWEIKEGDLPDMPVRWALFNPNDRKEVILATEVGVWGTNDITETDPIWSPHIEGLANVRVDMLQYRESDKKVLAGTFGRGFFTSKGFKEDVIPLIEAKFSADFTTIEVGSSVNFTDESTQFPETWEWTFEGGNVASFSGQNPPPIQYDMVGCYEVVLTVTKDLGLISDTETKTCYINVVPPNPCRTIMRFNVDDAAVVQAEDEMDFGVQYIDQDFKQPSSFMVSAGWSSQWRSNTVNGNKAIGATSKFENPGSASNWLILGPISIPEASAQLNWEHLFLDNNFRDGYEVIISSSGGQVANFSDPEAQVIAAFADNDLTTDGHITRTLQSVNIPANYMDKRVYIAFHHNADNQYAFYLDNITLNGCEPSNAPVADFVVDKTNIAVGQSVNFTDLSTDNPLFWLWDFDGGVGSTTVQNPSDVIFETAGCYEITLTASNHFGQDVESKTCYIDVQELPVANFHVDRWKIVPGDSINFTDASTGGPDDWNYTFNGADPISSSSQNPKDIKYNEIGCFPVRLDVHKGNLQGIPNIKECYIQVVEKPIAKFTADQTLISVGQSVSFQNQSSGGGDGWAWSFIGAEQSTSSAKNPSGIVYNTPGEYEVSLAVSVSGVHHSTEVKTKYIQVVDSPVAEFTANKTIINVNETVNFTDLSTGDADGWYWTFYGAETTNSIQENPVAIKYKNAGCFEVELKVFNTGVEGVEKRKLCYITVIDPTSVNEIDATDMEFYPNPVSKELKCKNLHGVWNYKLHNVHGKVVAIGSLKSEQDMINVGNLKNGTYYLKLQNNTKEIVKSVVIAR